MSRQVEIITPKLVVPYAGRWNLKVMRPDGRIRKELDFKNMILNSGLDQLCSNGGQVGQAIVVGSGNTAPAATQTQLDTLVATQSSGSSPFYTSAAEASAPYFSTSTVTRQFATGAAAGNLTEIGLCNGANQTTNPLFSRALILDGGGAPTTLTVLSDEILIATHYCRQYVPTSDVTGSITISGTTYNYTIRAAECTATNTGFKKVLDQTGLTNRQGGDAGFSASTQTLGTITGIPAGTPSSVVTGDFVVGSYTSGNYYRDITLNCPIGKMNSAGGIGSIVINTTRGSYQMSFSPVIPKDATKILQLVWRLGVARL